MGGTGKVLIIGEIIAINRQLINQFGGHFFENDQNLINPGSLEHVLAEIQGFLFDQELYPTIFHKAAIVCYRIIEGHVFHDGNKRTGMEVCRQMLELNGYRMRIDSEVITVAVRIATNDISFNTFTEWVEQRSERISE